MTKKVPASKKSEAMTGKYRIKREIQIGGGVGFVMYLLGILSSLSASNMRIRISLWIIGIGLSLLAFLCSGYFLWLVERIKRLLTGKGFDFVPKKK